jgi:hypothetical protein
VEENISGDGTATGSGPSVLPISRSSASGFFFKLQKKVAKGRKIHSVQHQGNMSPGVASLVYRMNIGDKKWLIYLNER